MSGEVSNSDSESDKEDIGDNNSMETKIDGVVMLNKTLSFLKPLKNVKIIVPMNLTVYMTRKHLKGCRTCAKCEFVYSFNLFEASDFYHTLIFWRDDSTYMPYASLLETYHSALEETLRVLCVYNTITGKKFKQDNVSQHPLGEAPKNSAVTIFMEDIEIFGQVFASELNAQVSRWTDSVVRDSLEWRFLSRCTGQSFDARPYINWTSERFNLDFAEEIVLHVAFDHFIDGVVLGWRADYIKSRMRGVTGTKYNPNALRGVMNQYFNLFRSSQEEPTAITMVKIYCDQNKFIKSIRPVPFKTPDISETIWKYCTTSIMIRTAAKMNTLRKKLQKFSYNVSVLKSTYSDVETAAARLEIFVSLRQGDLNLVNAVDMANTFRASKKLSRVRAFEQINPVYLLEHQRKYLVPVVNTLNGYIQSTLLALDNASFKIFEFNQGKVIIIKWISLP